VIEGCRRRPRRQRELPGAEQEFLAGLGEVREDLASLSAARKRLGEFIGEAVTLGYAEPSGD
jgi:hypothetical protein